MGGYIGEVIILLVKAEKEQMQTWISSVKEEGKVVFFSQRVFENRVLRENPKFVGW